MIKHHAASEDTPIYNSMPNRQKVERAMIRKPWDTKDALRKSQETIRKHERAAANR